jgi:hypothetical protein
MTTTPLCLPTSAIGGDTETFPISRAMQAPPIVTLQWGDTSGAHTVCTTRQVRDGIAHMFHREREQIWFHNGVFDIAVMLEWYPEFTGLIWAALMEGRVFDTMYLQRLAQIARGEMGGGLGLDMVAMQYGIRPPTKEILAEHPDYPGQVFDVRTSSGTWRTAFRTRGTGMRTMTERSCSRWRHGCGIASACHLGPARCHWSTPSP